MTNTKTYSLAEAATRIGVSAITLKRWLLRRKVDEVARDRNGWRVFTSQDIERIRKYAEKTTPPKGKT